MEIINGIILTGSVICALGAVGTVFVWIKKFILLCELVKKQGIERAEENRLLFEGQLLIIDLLEGGELNGRLTSHKNKMKELLYRKIS